MERKARRIVLIGPVFPYKGGISHYTGLMYRALSKEYDVYMLSYKLQYPKLLFKKEQRDYSNDMFRIDDTDFFINTAIPFNWVATARRIKKLHPDLVIMQWWHPYFAPCYWTICRMLGKIRGMFLCHNVFPHEHFPMDRVLCRTVLKKGDYFITQSSMDTEDLLTVKQDAQYRQTVHPTYNAFKIKGMSGAEARQILDISEGEKALLFFGFVREYKGLRYLIDALPKVAGRLENVRLYIVGDFGGDKKTYLEQIHANNVDDMVRIFDGYTPDQEVEKFFAACDVVVLPYESATQSGIVQIAYGFDKPVIVTNVGGLPDVVTNGETGYVVPPQDTDALADAICRFFEGNTDFAANIRREAYRFSWDRISEIINDMVEWPE